MAYFPMCVQIVEILDVLLTYVESKHNKDQFYLLILEPRCAEILYALLLEKIFSVELREKVLKVINFEAFDNMEFIAY